MEPGIIKLSLKENVEWTLEDAKETHKANLELSQGEKFCIYMNASKFFIPSKEAQQFISSKEVTVHRLGAAFVVKNAGLKLLANLFVKFFKSNSPTRIFTSEDEAFKWMRKLLKEAEKI